MKPYIWLLMILAVVLAVVGFAPQVQAAPTTVPTHFMSPLKPVKTSYKYKGQMADAYFGEAIDECTYRDAYLFVGQNVIKSGPGKPVSGQFANVGVYEYNFCTGDMLKYQYGYAPVDSNSFQIDKQLNSAHVQTAIPVFDELTGASYTLDVDVAWTGTGELSKSRSQYQYQTQGCRYSSRFNGSSRQATASGTISDGTTNYATSVAYADLQSVKNGEMMVGCGS